jgi:hypothetical protein
MFLVRVVDGKALAQFDCGGPNYMVFVRVIGRFPAKNVYSDRAFFDLLGLSIQCFFDHIFQELDGSLI